MNYRFFRLNGSGVVDSVQVLPMADDAAAITHAEGLGNGAIVEVWTNDRKIASIAPTRR